MSQSLRIGFFLGSFPVISETFILRQITGLLELGHDVRIFADTKPGEPGPTHPEVARFKLADRTTYVDGPPESLVWELPVRPFLGRTWPVGASKPVLNLRRLAQATPKFLSCLFRAPTFLSQVLSAQRYGYQATSLSGLYRLATVCKQSPRFDVLHAHFGPVGNSYRFARDLFQAPLVVSFHGYDFSTRPRKEGGGMYENLFHMADLITVNSNFTQSRVESLGCSKDKLRKLPVGLDQREFSFRERSLRPGEPVRLLTIARLTEIKGHEYAIRAVARLRQTIPAVRYDIVGDGPLRKPLEELARELGLADAVAFHGALGSNEIKSLLGQAHLFLLPSVSVEGDQEGQGLVLQEAQACGLPVVATQHGALPEGLLDGLSGYLVAERDVDALAMRLDSLINRAATWPAMGQAGRAFVEEHFDIRKLNDRLVAIYSEAIAKYRTR